jgi:hypothetical protein
MKILKIQLRNYRGVIDRTVEFRPEGVTIVEGPNEIGKSSIAEAIDRIIDDLDSTSKQRVLALKPVGRDAGPEVMIEVETGPYAFQYRKRFLRDRVTELEISRPRPENHTGREAHDRVQAILNETVDLALWKALRMQQGDVVGQPALANRISLSDALDRSAGESPAGGEGESVFDSAHNAYLEYWTETGRRKQVAVENERAIERGAQEIGRIQEALRAIEADVESSVRLESEVRGLLDRGLELRANIGQHQDRANAIAKIEAAVETIEARLNAAQLVAKEARRLEKARQLAISAFAGAVSAYEQLGTHEQEDGSQLENAQARVTVAAVAVAGAREAREAAKTHAGKQQARLSQLRDAADLASLIERRDRVQVALAALEAVAADAAIPVDFDALESIRAQHRIVELARARLEVSRPLVSVAAHADLAGVVDGRAVKVSANEKLELRLDQSLTLTLPNVVSISVVVGASGDLTSSELETAERRLGDLLLAAGASDLMDAERLSRSREEAAWTVADQQRVMRDNLGENGLVDLDERIAALRGRMAPNNAKSVGKSRDSQDRARRAADEAERALTSTEQAARAAEQEWEAARSKTAELELSRSERKADLRLAAEEVERRRTSLAEERIEVSDDCLKANLTTAEQAEGSLRTELEVARADLAGEGPTQARERLDNAKRALTRVDDDTRQAEDELLQVKTRLRDHGEDGLDEDLQETIIAHDHAELEMKRYSAHATARRLLFETLRAEREATRRSYVAPLRREIENLGKIVFGADFAVELDALDLSVVSRTARGQTIPYASLSVGAKEQIALISRLACATIVAPAGGVPVILDDALGNSDPQRLEAMGAALAVAGRQSQIIVLTCQPDRYEHVGGARVVRLS